MMRRLVVVVCAQLNVARNAVVVSRCERPLNEILRPRQRTWSIASVPLDRLRVLP